MPNTYSTDFVMGVLQDLTVPRGGLLSRFFPMIQTEESEEKLISIFPNAASAFRVLHAQMRMFD